MKTHVKGFVIRRRKLLIISGILLLLYILLPMGIRAVYPFDICEYDPDDVIAIEIRGESESLMIEDRDQIEAFIERLNNKRYVFWSVPLSLGSGGSSHLLKIVTGDGLYDRDVWGVRDHYIEDGLVLYTDMTFITELVP